MRTVGALGARLAFTKLWRTRGEPTLKIIQPISTWTLPGGVTYNAQFAQFVNGAGDVVAVSWATQPGATVGFLVNQSRRDVALEVPGVLTTDSIEVVLLWSADVQSRIQTCWGVVIDNKVYRVKEWEVVPMGTPTPTEIRVRLGEV